MQAVGLEIAEGSKAAQDDSEDSVTDHSTAEGRSD